MTDSNSTQLSLSTRDAQFLAASLCVAASLLNPDATDDAWHNEAMLKALFSRHYSAAEFNDLLHRAKAVVPADSPLGFVDVPSLRLQTTLVS